MSNGTDPFGGQRGRPLKLLVERLDSQHFQFRGSQVFRWMLESILVRVGVKHNCDVPKEGQELVNECVDLYRQSVISAGPFEDLLGPVYMQLATKYARDGLGQYFTPSCISGLMAAVLVGDEKFDRPLTKFMEPCVGSGALVLGLVKHVLGTHGPQKLLKLSLTGVDLDPVCVHMFAVQMLASMLFHDLPVGEVVAVHGNSIVPQRAWKVVLHASHASIDADLLQGGKADGGNDVRSEDAVCRQQVQAQQTGQIDMFG